MQSLFLIFALCTAAGGDVKDVSIPNIAFEKYTLPNGMDVILQVPHWPSPDVSTHADLAVETMGGKATNTATHLAASTLK